MATFREKKRERNLFEYLGALWVRLPTIGGDGGRWTDAEDVSFEADFHGCGLSGGRQLPGPIGASTWTTDIRWVEIESGLD